MSGSPLPTEPAFDYLIISDLHLRGGFNERTEGLYHFDEELADLLRYYRLHRASARPWTLIIGGDLIEFHYVKQLPDLGDPLARGLSFSEEETRHGPSSEALKARWKLDRILRTSHPQLLLALARFVAEGNHVVLVRGNHDAELVWPEVQEHFRRLIAEHHPVDVSYMDMKRAVAERVHFAPWFWYVPGQLYVEHGCQYDPFCSFEYFLNPVLPADPTRIENSISDLSIRYFASQVKLVDAMTAESIRSASEYLRWLVRGNLMLLPRAFRLYSGMVRRVLAQSGTPDPIAEGAVRATHEERLRAADALFGVPPGRSAAVHSLHATPIMRSTGATARFLGLDLSLAAVVVAVTAIVVAIAYPARTALLVFLGVLAIVGAVIYIGTLRVRRIQEYGHLRRTAERVAELFAVPVVVFGHSHRAGLWALPRGAQYFNIGTWIPNVRHAYFVYLAITRDGAERDARLCRWNKSKGEPEPFGVEKVES